MNTTEINLMQDNAKQYAEAVIQAWNNEEKHVPIYPAFVLAREYLLTQSSSERGGEV